MNSDELNQAILSHPKNQGQIAQDLGITSTTLGRWRKGERSFGQSDQKLLRLYFLGEMPFDMLREPGSDSGQLRFTLPEWQIITILSKREGFTTPAAWITGKIRGYLDNNPTATELSSPGKYNLTPKPPAFLSEDPGPDYNAELKAAKKRPAKKNPNKGTA